MVAQPMLPLASSLEEAEDIVMGLCAVLLGDRAADPKDRGLLNLIVHGRQHVPTCSHGQWLRSDSPRPHGDPCSDRCLAAHAAIDAAERWLRARDDAPVAASAGGVGR